MKSNKQKVKEGEKLKSFVWKTFFRFVYLVCNENSYIVIHVNIDQTRIIFVQKANVATYNKKADQVEIHVKHNNHALTWVI